jgi:hypothetical protein
MELVKLDSNGESSAEQKPVPKDERDLLSSMVDSSSETDTSQGLNSGAAGFNSDFSKHPSSSSGSGGICSARIHPFITIFKIYLNYSSVGASNTGNSFGGGSGNGSGGSGSQGGSGGSKNGGSDSTNGKKSNL